jgi:hypothetical protein
MKAHWLVAKYMSDLRKREPVNVGVIVFCGDEVKSRFLGQQPDGKIDRRRVRWVRSPENFEAWVAYWQHAVSRGRDLDVQGLVRRLGDENYFLESAGERLTGDEVSTEDLLDEMYATLVDTADLRSMGVRRLSQAALNRLDLGERLVSDYHLDVGVDSIHFDYRFENGHQHLMQCVSLVGTGEQAWDRIHACTWAFEKARLEVADAGRISLVKRREEKDEVLDRQLKLLQDYSAVVDVGRPEKAAGDLSSLLQVSSPT